MNQHPTYRLEDLIFDLTEIPASDILVNVDFSKKELFQLKEGNQDLFEFPLDSQWNALLKTAVQNKRQSDTDTLCLVAEGLEWEYKGKKVVSPLLLVPVTYKINKIKQTVQIIQSEDDALINPFVKNELKRRYYLVWEENPETGFSQKTIEFYHFLEENQFSFAKKSLRAFGNFHHHRFQIVRDLEALAKTELNPLVNEILGNPGPGIFEKPSLTKQNIVPADKDQKSVFEKLEAGNLVIQGPPGTGKSQVLTNLLAKLLDKGSMSLVVSEKKAALEVLVKKLSAYQLDPFTFISHNQSKPADFIARLKKTWSLLEIKPEAPAKNLLLSEQLLSQLQLTLDKLNSKNLIGGTGLTEFTKLMQPYDLENVPYSSNVPLISEWLNEKEKVLQLSESLSSFHTLKHFKQQGLSEVLKLDRILAELKADFQALTAELEFSTFEELENRLKQIARCQILENESYKKYAKLFSSKKDRRKFEKLRTAFLRQTETFQLLQTEAKNWKEQPTLSLAQSWKTQLEASWWKKRKAAKQIAALLTSNVLLPGIAINNWLAYLDAESALQSTVSALQELGIERPGIELESVNYLLNQLEKEDVNELNKVSELSPALRKKLVDSANALQQAYRNLKNILNNDLSDHVVEVIETAEKNLSEIIPVQEILKTLPEQVYRLLQQHDSAEAAEKSILKSNWIQFESRFPELAKLDGPALKDKIRKIISLELEENKIFGANLVFRQHIKFEEYHQLLRKPAAKSTAEEKALKAQLKTGKSILVREFSKTRQFRTIRELLDSEARLWIELLTPIWLSTPTQVAASFPMEKGLFACAIFDEASQIPLSHALGSLQRAERAIVAGDEQQMSPMSYFSGISSGVDLLHQASYYWEKTALKHHYRSIHPELISFSNRFFYNNELIAYPSAKRAEEPLRFHFVPQGIYDNRQNTEEAKAIAKQVELQLKQEATIGIAAFSEQQLDCIWKVLPDKAQNELIQRIEAGKAFFKALEQVQGDECDRLIISLGYGKNPSGEFHMRFGPLNQKNGSKRLNVLLSRAKESIDFFSSVKASDLSVSTNEAVNLLRFFLMQSEQHAEKKEIIFPFGLKPTIRGNVLEFENIAQDLGDAEELVTLQNVLENRGWELRL